MKNKTIFTLFNKAGNLLESIDGYVREDVGDFSLVLSQVFKVNEGEVTGSNNLLTCRPIGILENLGDAELVTLFTNTINSVTHQENPTALNNDLKNFLYFNTTGNDSGIDCSHYDFKQGFTLAVSTKEMGWLQLTIPTGTSEEKVNQYLSRVNAAFIAALSLMKDPGKTSGDTHSRTAPNVSTLYTTSQVGWKDTTTLGEGVTLHQHTSPGTVEPSLDQGEITSEEMTLTAAQAQIAKYPKFNPNSKEDIDFLSSIGLIFKLDTGQNNFFIGDATFSNNMLWVMVKGKNWLSHDPCTGGESWKTWAREMRNNLAFIPPVAKVGVKELTELGFIFTAPTGTEPDKNSPQTDRVSYLVGSMFYTWLRGRIYQIDISTSSSLDILSQFGQQVTEEVSDLSSRISGRLAQTAGETETPKKSEALNEVAAAKESVINQKVAVFSVVTESDFSTVLAVYVLSGDLQTAIDRGLSSYLQAPLSWNWNKVRNPGGDDELYLVLSESRYLATFHQTLLNTKEQLGLTETFTQYRVPVNVPVPKPTFSLM